jgi:hypothetical protein
VLGAYNPCAESHANVLGLQPIFVAMSLPLCIVGCLTKVIEALSNPSEIPNVPAACACLSTFTPAAFCGMVKGMVQSVVVLLDCFLGMLGDLVAQQANAVSKLSSPNADIRAAGQCLMDEVDQLSKGLSDAFGPVSVFFDSIGFLFTFIGMSPVSLGTINPGPIADMIADLQAVSATIQSVLSVIPC